jgi:hypothetical protein
MASKYKQTLKLYRLKPGDPKAAPEPAGEIPIQSDTVAGLLPAAEEALLAAGHGRWRSLTYAPSGLVAYIEREA